ncbi:cyclase family protein [Nonomuraea ferruginea]
MDATVALGRDLTPDDGVDADLLDAWFRTRPLLAPGSVVLIRTGWDRHWDDNATFLGTSTGAPGVTLTGAEWLTSHGIIASGTDTVAYEKMLGGDVAGPLSSAGGPRCADHGGDEPRTSQRARGLGVLLHRRAASHPRRHRLTDTSTGPGTSDVRAVHPLSSSEIGWPALG